MPINATLSEMKYIHECLIENKDPVLVLVELKNVNTDLTSNRKPSNIDTNANTNRKSANRDRFTINKLEENAHIINKSKLDGFLKAIIKNRNLIEETIDANGSISSFSNQLDTLINWCINIREKLKCIMALIYNIHFESIEKLIERIEFYEKSLRTYQSGRYMKEKQPLMMSITDESPESLNGSSDSNLQMLYSNLLDACNESLHAIGTFTNCVSFSFYWAFKLQPVYTNSTKNDGSSIQNSAESLHEAEKIEVIQADEKVIIYFNGLSRIHSFFNSLAGVLNQQTELFLKFSICYGTKVLDSVIIRLDKLDKFLSKKTHYFTKAQR